MLYCGVFRASGKVGIRRQILGRCSGNISGTGLVMLAKISV